MTFNDNHDCPFEAYITNLGKYNEGALVGEWVKFPTTPETLQEVFQRIGIDGKQYEEWFITDYDCYVDDLYNVLGEYESLDELNYLASKIEEMDDSEYNAFTAAIEMGEHRGGVKDLINLADNTENYDFLPEVENHYDLGYYYVHEVGGYNLDSIGQLANYIDYEAFGRDIAMEEVSEFVNGGYIYHNGNSLTENYDGTREDIPYEYRVTVSVEETAFAMEDRLDATIDLAFDLDEFFRGYHPEYNRALQDPQTAKEALADNLLSGDTGNIRMTLALLEQEHELAKEVAPLVERLTAYEDEYRIYTYSIYQLKDREEMRDYRFEPLDRLEQHGLTVNQEHYNLVYASSLTGADSLESLYQKFNLDRPADFKGHSMSVSDIVVLHQNGEDTAHYCDSFGFSQVSQFLEKENYLKNAEMAMEDDYGMIDGIVNNGPRIEEKETSTEKPSVLGQLSQAKKECAERTPNAAEPKKKVPER